MRFRKLVQSPTASEAGLGPPPPTFLQSLHKNKTMARASKPKPMPKMTLKRGGMMAAGRR